MENIYLTPKDIIGIKVAGDYEQRTNIEYSKIVLEKIRLLIELMNSLYTEKVSIPSWKGWSESIVYKLCFHSASLIKLFEGTELPYEYNGKLFKVLDESSIYSLLRVVTENYLTFSYLYTDKTKEEEKQFRLSVWRYCGIKQRVEFKMSTEEAKRKQEEEKKLLSDLRQEIIDSDYFKNFDNKKQSRILEGKKPRLFNTWMQLVKQSGLRVRLFDNLYGYKSNHAHSEFIGVLQIKSKNYTFNPNEKVHFALFLLHILICKSIIDLTSVFPSTKDLFDKRDYNIKTEIEILYRTGIDTNLDNEQT